MAAQNATPYQFTFRVPQNSIFTGGASAASFGNPWKPGAFTWTFPGFSPNMSDPSATNQQPKVTLKTTEDIELERHLELFSTNGRNQAGSAGPKPSPSDSALEEMRAAPLFSAEVRQHVTKKQPFNFTRDNASNFPQHGLIGLKLETYGDSNELETKPGPAKETDGLVYANISAPWSTFICGSQGSGKSHTLSCLLENTLLAPSKTGRLQNPLAGIVFHYDKFTNFSTTQLCEAAYLCSGGVPVRVLVSPSNFKTMERLYRTLPGLSARSPKPKVVPMYFREEHLNITMMKTLMAIGGEGYTPLYIEVSRYISCEYIQTSLTLARYLAKCYARWPRNHKGLPD